ncbi:MAG TPA: hypothetical protein VJL29_02680 [Thermoguttaceae bacterium]|nr:hypothetical protein [Thermoguttaceae bacterium]
MHYVALAVVVLVLLVLGIFALPGRGAKAQQTPPPAATAPEPKPLAMCYDVSALPAASEYVCPKCGEKTDYKKPDRVIDAIPACRREVAAMKPLTKLRLTLDESACCAKCMPKSPGPSLSLDIHFLDGSKRTVRNVTHNDLKQLREFLAGKLSAEKFAKQSKSFAEAIPAINKALEAERKSLGLDQPAKKTKESPATNESLPKTPEGPRP